MALKKKYILFVFINFPPVSLFLHLLPFPFLPPSVFFSIPFVPLAVKSCGVGKYKMREKKKEEKKIRDEECIVAMACTWKDTINIFFFPTSHAGFFPVSFGPSSSLIFASFHGLIIISMRALFFFFSRFFFFFYCLLCFCCCCFCWCCCCFYCCNCCCCHCY